MTLQDSALLAALLAGLANSGMAIYAILAFRLQKRAIGLEVEALRLTEHAHGSGAIFQVLSREYLDRQFSIVAPPVIDGREITNVREAKARALLIRAASAAQWDAAAADSHTWHYRLAFELSSAMQRLGIAMFTGLLPARVIVPFVADQFLQDWPLCYTFVQSLRANSATQHRLGTHHYYRRHAEWLALLSGVWMQQHFPSFPELDVIKALYSDDLPGALLRLTYAERCLMPEVTRRDLVSLLQAHDGALPFLGTATLTAKTEVEWLSGSGRPA